MFKPLSTSLIARGILISGIWMLVQGTELRRTGKTLHSVRPGMPEKKAA